MSFAMTHGVEASGSKIPSWHRDLWDPVEPGRWPNSAMVLVPGCTKQFSNSCPLPTALSAQGPAEVQ